MSVRVMSAVFERYPGAGGEMVLALALADVARDDGRLMINDSVVELARKTRQTERGVRGQLRRMETIGWLHVVRASDGGRGRPTIYAIDEEWIKGGELRPRQVDPETRNEETQNPEPASGFDNSETRNAATQNPERGSGAYRPTRPNTEIPPNPPRGGEHGPKKSRGREPSAPLTLKAWLALCKAKGEKAIPADDPVYAYAEQVGISIELLHLHWHEFKARRIDTNKRQRDWRQTFRNSVRDNWYGLWWMPPGKPAEITSKGRQAEAAQEAQAA